MSNNYSQEDASPFNSPFMTKERSNSIQLPLGNGLASIFLPVSFSQDNINDLMNLASKFEFEDENEEQEEEQIEELTQQQITLSLCSNNSSKMDNVVCN